MTDGHPTSFMRSLNVDSEKEIAVSAGAIEFAPFLARRTVNEERNGCMSSFMTSGRAV